MATKTPCNKCRDAFEISNKTTPCDTCRPFLFPENRDCMEVYNLVKNQYIVGGMGDPIGLSMPAVKIAMDMLGIDDQLSCLRKIEIVADAFLNKKEMTKKKVGK